MVDNINVYLLFPLEYIYKFAQTIHFNDSNFDSKTVHQHCNMYSDYSHRQKIHKEILRYDS